MPEWAPRVIYVSAYAREIWQPRIQAVSNAWIQAERDSVAAGIRKSALQHVSPERLPELLRAEAARGLLVLPLGQVPKVTGYQSATKELKPGDAFDYKVAITRPEHAAAWIEAWASSDDREIGRLLSTPECCTEAFLKYWVQEKWIDLTWPTRGEGAYNGLLRWLGVRGVSHLPCSPNCWETICLQDALLDNMADNQPTEWRWLEQMLSWPTLWTSLNGIAEITNPVLKMSVPTDPLDEKAEVRFLGSDYPDEGAQGKVFPFRAKIEKALLDKTQISSLDNGFKTMETQNAAHEVLLKKLEGMEFGTVLDLGCGDGTLLTKIKCERRVGVESDPARANKAKGRIHRVEQGDCTDPVFLHNLFASEFPINLVIAQKDRNPAHKLPPGSAYVLLYTYEGKVEASLIPCQTLLTQ
jgi:hypothetical protein